MQLFTFFNMGLNLCVHGNICLMMLGLLGLGGTWYMSCIGQDTLRICFMLISCWQAACQRITLHPAKKKQLSHASGAKNLFQRLAVMIHDSRIDCCFACHKIARSAISLRLSVTMNWRVQLLQCVSCLLYSLVVSCCGCTCGSSAALCALNLH